MDDVNLASREEERRRVLDMLEQGKISAGEADELLAALEGDSPAAVVRPSVIPRPRVRRGPPAFGLLALVVVIARVLARTIGRVSFVVGRAAGVLARLLGWAQTESRPRKR